MTNVLLLASAILLLLPAWVRAQALPDFAKARDEAVKNLQNLVRIDSSNPPGNETKVAEYLKSIFDREGISSEIVALEPARGNIIARLKGNGKKKPLLLMGHEDVVGVERDKWTVDPFAGIVKDGYVYGRGSGDDKSGVTTMLEVFLMLHRQKAPLDRDVIFLAEAGEEGGPPVGINFLAEKHWPKIESEFALNEGGGVHVENGKAVFAAIETAEKLPRALHLKARGVSGHGSVPRLDNPILHLATAVEKIGNLQLPMQLNETTRTFFQRLAKISPPDEAFLLTHLEDPEVGTLVQETLRRSKNRSFLTYNSMLRTSISPNIIRGGFRTNVIPADAEATLDVRLLPGQEIATVADQLRRLINDPAVEVEGAEFAQMPPSPPSRLDSDMFKALEKSQATVFPGAVTVPYMSTGATDSAELRVKGVQAYGVGGPTTDEDAGRIHGNDERFSIESLGKFVEYVYRAVADVAVAH